MYIIIWKVVSSRTIFLYSLSHSALRLLFSPVKLKTWIHQTYSFNTQRLFPACGARTRRKTTVQDLNCKEVKEESIQNTLNRLAKQRYGDSIAEWSTKNSDESYTFRSWNRRETPKIQTTHIPKVGDSSASQKKSQSTNVHNYFGLQCVQLYPWLNKYNETMKQTVVTFDKPAFAYRLITSFPLPPLPPN